MSGRSIAATKAALAMIDRTGCTLVHAARTHNVDPTTLRRARKAKGLPQLPLGRNQYTRWSTQA